MEESIPVDYNHTPFRPRVYRGALDRYLYFKDMVEKVRIQPGGVIMFDEYGDTRWPAPPRPSTSSSATSQKP